MVSWGLQGPRLGLQKSFSPLSWLPWSWPRPCQSHLVGVQDREDDEVLGLPVTERRDEDGWDLMVMDLNTCNWLLRAHPTLPSPVGGRDLCGLLGVLDNTAVDAFPLLGQLGMAVALAPGRFPCSD